MKKKIDEAKQINIVEDVTPKRNNNSKRLFSRMLPWVIAIIVVLIALIVGAGIEGGLELRKFDTICNAITISDTKEVELSKEAVEIKAADFITSMPEEYTNQVSVTFGNGEDVFKLEANELMTKTITIDVTVNDLWLVEKFKGNVKQYEVNIAVVDTIAPEFTESVEKITVVEGEELTEEAIKEKFKATDISGEVAINVDGTVDTSTVGEKTTIVSATDKNGKITQKEVKIKVTSKTEETTTQKASNSGSSSGTSTTRPSTSSSNSATTTTKKPTTSSNNSGSSASTTKPSTSSSATTTTQPAISHCTNNSNHSISCGDMGKWFGSRSELVAYYKGVVGKYNARVDAGEITTTEYYQNCPQGYECWSCSYCGKWTGNYKYDKK